MNILSAGWQALVDYLTITRVISLAFAFFLSGAISSFMAKNAVMKYFGPKAHKGMAYTIASASGAILAVCSCSVLPMFASIRRKGAGIGPAITFLFAGPAINVLAIIFTFTLISPSIGVARVSASMFVAIVIGLIMSILYQNTEEQDPNSDMFEIKDETERKGWQTALYFLSLLGILISGVKHPITTTIFFILLALILITSFSKDEVLGWCEETWGLTKKIAPLFIVGVFVAGIITAIIPQTFMVKYAGSNTISSNILASIFGAFMYFATLTEVPIVNSFMALEMNKGPILALLLAGPSLSLPNMLIIGKVMGWKKTSTYITLVVVLSALFGLTFGFIRA